MQIHLNHHMAGEELKPLKQLVKGDLGKGGNILCP